MALRQIRTYGDPVLEKKCREVKEITPRIRELIQDMLETMYDHEGVGLAAPQVGVLRRIVVIDVSDATEPEETDGLEGSGQEGAESPGTGQGEGGTRSKGDKRGPDQQDQGKQDQGKQEKKQDRQEKKEEPDNRRPDGTEVPAWQGPLVMINPQILETWGEQKGSEGCLSVPGKAGEVTRPNYVKAKALNEDMEEFEVEATGLLARAIFHEVDHLDGIVYVTRVEGDLYDVKEEEE